jgi:hypothetical protein
MVCEFAGLIFGWVYIRNAVSIIGIIMLIQGGLIFGEGAYSWRSVYILVLFKQIRFHLNFAFINEKPSFKKMLKK